MRRKLRRHSVRSYLHSSLRGVLTILWYWSIPSVRTVFLTHCGHWGTGCAMSTAPSTPCVMPCVTRRFATPSGTSYCASGIKGKRASLTFSRDKPSAFARMIHCKRAEHHSVCIHETEELGYGLYCSAKLNCAKPF